MGITDLIGLMAASCTTIAYFPQVLKVWRSKSANDISIFMYIILCIGLLLWLIYGCIKKDVPLIMANSITLVFALSILFMKIAYQ